MSRGAAPRLYVLAGVNGAGKSSIGGAMIRASGADYYNPDEAAKALIGSRLDDAAVRAVATACSAACRPIDDKRGTIAYRTKVAGVLLTRAVAIAARRAGGH